MRIKYRRMGYTLVEVLVGLAIIGILASLLLPAVQNAREAARRVDCSSRLRQIGFGLIAYHDTQGSFPPSVVDRAGGNAKLHTWLAMLLPYVDQTPLYNTYDFNVGFADRLNQPVVRQTIPLYVCPSADRSEIEGQGFGPCNFACNSGTEPGVEDGMLFPASTVRLVDVLDGESQTLLVGELYYHNLGWARGSAAGLGGGGGGGQSSGYARGVSRWWRCASPCAKPGLNPPRTACSNRCEQRFQMSSKHVDGANVALCDGRVCFWSDHMNESVMKAYFTRQGNETNNDEY